MPERTMRYSDTHKDETRRKVVRAAAAAVRAKGPDGVGVAGIMAEAGLTHGGFYAHFPSKEALVAAAVDEAFAAGSRRFDRMTAGVSPAEGLSRLVDAYVSLAHRDQPQSGCPVATLSSDLPRQGPEVRAAYERGLRALIGRIAKGLPETVAGRESLAASLVAEMAGSVLISRALSNDAEAADLLAAVRRRIKHRMGIVQ